MLWTHQTEISSKNIWPYAIEKATKSLFVVSRKCTSIGHMTKKIALQLFDCYVSLILHYGFELWDNQREIQCIERVQLRYLKYILGGKDSTCSSEEYGEFGRFPFYITHAINIVKYWGWRWLLSLHSNSLAKKHM